MTDDTPTGDASADRDGPARADLVEDVSTGGLRPPERTPDAATDPDGESDVGRRRFGGLLVGGAAGLAGLASLGGSAAATEEWHEEYYAYLEEAVPTMQAELATPETVETMLAAEAEASPFFAVLGERLDLDEATIQAASIDVEPCGTPPLPEPWRPPIRDLLEDLPIPQRCPAQPCPDPHPEFLLVPTLTAHVRGPEGDAFVQIDPTGDSVGSFVGDVDPDCRAAPDCDPPRDPPVFTAEGWGELPVGGVDFQGDPVPLPL